MYLIIKILIVVLCLSGLLYTIKIYAKYKNDTLSKEEIIAYFKKQKAFNLESGIKTKDLPKEIAKNPYILMMAKDKTLTFEKGKYYLNREVTKK